MTTSARRSGSRVSAARTSLCPGVTLTSAGLLPIRRIVRTTSPAGTLPSVNCPVAPVAVERVVPRTITRAPSSGCPVWASVTVPVTVRVCAKAGTETSTKANAANALRNRINPPGMVRLTRRGAVIDYTGMNYSAICQYQPGGVTRRCGRLHARRYDRLRSGRGGCDNPPHRVSPDTVELAEPRSRKQPEVVGQRCVMIVRRGMLQQALDFLRRAIT